MKKSEILKKMSVGCPVYWVAPKRFPLVWTAGNGLKDPPNWFISYWIHPQPGHGPTDSKKCPKKFFYWIHYTLYSGQPTLKITKIGSGELIFES